MTFAAVSSRRQRQQRRRTSRRLPRSVNIDSQFEDGVEMTPEATLMGKLTLVTGAGTGVGLGIAQSLALAGAAVVLHYATSADGAADAVAEITRTGGRATAIQADLSSVAECGRLIDEAVRFLGGLDVLVNNAGRTFTKSIADVTQEEFDLTFAVNVRGMYFCTQQALPHLLARGDGSIINLSSIHGQFGNPRSTVYGATKAAVLGFTRECAQELAPSGIRVNAIAPGLIEVPRYFRTMPHYTSEGGDRMVPLGRAAGQRTSGQWPCFSPPTPRAFITGQTIFVDGGTSTRMALFPQR